MKSLMRFAIVALGLILGLAWGLGSTRAAPADAPAAVASPTGTVAPGGAGGGPTAQDLGLPAIQTPTSERFDLHGTVTVDTQTITLGGNGAVAGQSVQLDLTLAVPDVPGPIAVHVIGIGQQVYLRIGDSGPWQLLDASTGAGAIPGLGGVMPGMGGTMPGVGGVLPGMGGTVPGVGGLLPGMGTTGKGPGNMSPAELLQLLKASIHTQNLGKDAVQGAATTKYQVDVDLAKLVAGLGTSMTPEEQQALASSTFRMFLWVGDANQYLYQLQILLNARIPSGSSGTPSAVALDFMVTFHDFDVPVQITAPTDVAPAGGTGTIPVIAPAPGMPRTGAPATFPLWPLLALALGLVAAGIRLRRSSQF